MDDIQCNEDDKNISNCRARLISHYCRHDEDIWLQCKGKFTKSKNKTLELQIYFCYFKTSFSDKNKFSN